MPPENRNLTERLDLLVLECVLESWEIVKVDDEGIEGREGKFRNTQKLRLLFPDGHKLEVGTFCSGCAENTCFV